jgi:hypothetical protein
MSPSCIGSGRMVLEGAPSALVGSLQAYARPDADALASARR